METSGDYLKRHSDTNALEILLCCSFTLKLFMRSNVTGVLKKSPSTDNREAKSHPCFILNCNQVFFKL